MKIILKQDVKDLGKAGEIRSVKPGFARNYLFPKKLAEEFNDKNNKQWLHLKKMAEIKSKKALSQRKKLIEKLKNQKITFYRQVSDGKKLFGSVTALDLSSKLEKLGFMVDKKDIYLKPIKSVGEYKANINLGKDLETDISILIKKQEALKKE